MSAASKVRVGVIGYGYWGPNLVRNFAESGGAQVDAVSDMKPERSALVESRYPGVRASADAGSLLADPALDAVAIATPVSTHFELGMKALAAGKHVFMEKPLAATSEQALQLIEEAERRRRVLLVDHTFVYTGAVRKIRELVEQGGRPTMDPFGIETEIFSNADGPCFRNDLETLSRMASVSFIAVLLPVVEEA